MEELTAATWSARSFVRWLLSHQTTASRKPVWMVILAPFNGIGVETWVAAICGIRFRGQLLLVSFGRIDSKLSVTF